MEPEKLINRAISSPNQPNLLLYGAIGNHSYSCFFDILCKQYPSLKLQTIDYGSFTYKRFHWYYEFTFIEIQKKNRDIFWSHLLEIVSTPSTSGHKRMVIFKDTQKMMDHFQDKMRVVLEKYSWFNTFVVFSVNITSLSDAFRSRFLNIRFPIKDKDHTGDVIPSDIICNDIMKMYDHDFREIRKCDIQSIKDICHNLLKYDVNLSEWFQVLTRRCFENPKWTAAIKTSIIKEIAECESKLKGSYRTMIHIESLLISLYHITSFAHYEVDSDKEERVHVLGNTATPE